jgi:hypothetical protein
MVGIATDITTETRGGDGLGRRIQLEYESQGYVLGVRLG